MRIDLSKLLVIEQRGPRFYLVVDKRGANAVEAGPFETFKMAQDEWKRQADDILLEWTAPKTASQQ